MQLTILVIATCKKGLVRLTTLLDILLLPHQEAVYRFAVLLTMLPNSNSVVPMLRIVQAQSTVQL